MWNVLTREVEVVRKMFGTFIRVNYIFVDLILFIFFFLSFSFYHLSWYNGVKIYLVANWTW